MQNFYTLSGDEYEVSGIRKWGCEDFRDRAIFPTQHAKKLQTEAIRKHFTKQEGTARDPLYKADNGTQIPAT